ncbi:signal peptidase I [Klenkia brasiliensis]|uniref:Signal peptidase I n=1 Tax=Klenkia brasiliensis TaxID=333142 RepID=A0A1G7T7U3_9ACTN|nr:signal peptidase I [Klenkia brasiliensis]SDG31383.1 signal peptidase I [Klenkia brasiliensis]
MDGVGHRRPRLSTCGTALAVTALLVVTASVLGVLPLQPVRTGSGSMAPAAPTGALLLVQHGAGQVGRRDVVTVSADVTGEPLVKRVVAVGGDEVAIEDGVLVVDGRPVCERDVDPDRLDGVWFGPVRVPAGSVFLLGDDRAGSVDSRVFGAVPVAALTGRVLLRLWPAPAALDDGLC